MALRAARFATFRTSFTPVASVSCCKYLVLSARDCHGVIALAAVRLSPSSGTVWVFEKEDDPVIVDAMI
jgi:hypothetical protein